MTLTEIKTVIHEDIDKINDAELLDILKIFIETHIFNANEPVLTDEQSKRLEISRKQLNNGDTISNEDVDNEFDIWLKK